IVFFPIATDREASHDDLAEILGRGELLDQQRVLVVGFRVAVGEEFTLGTFEDRFFFQRRIRPGLVGFAILVGGLGKFLLPEQGIALFQVLARFGLVGPAPDGLLETGKRALWRESIEPADVFLGRGYLGEVVRDLVAFVVEEAAFTVDVVAAARNVALALLI